MGRIDAVAHDPSVADYRATSPRCAQGGTDDIPYYAAASPSSTCTRLTQ